MQPGLSSDSSYEERPSLGASVEAVLAGWRRACEHCTAPGQHVRALLILGEDRREFCWREGVIHRLFSTEESRPATASEQEMLRRFITHGWFLVYRLEAGQEPVVLHNVGIEVTATQEESVPARDAPHQGDVQGETGYGRQSGDENRESQKDEAPPHTPASSAPHSRKMRLVPSFPVLLLLCGAVGMGGALGWFFTRKIAVGVGVAALVLVLALFFLLWRRGQA
jgi:hypothetical protein